MPSDKEDETLSAPNYITQNKMKKVVFFLKYLTEKHNMEMTGTLIKICFEEKL